MMDSHNVQVTPHLYTIYQAYDRIYAIASHRWNATCFYNAEERTSNLFGHYVRTLPRFADHDPSFITEDQYRAYGSTLRDAFNIVLPHILPDNLKSNTIESISAGTAPVFYHDTAYERCMAAFHLVEKVYPRSLLRDPASPRKRKPKSHKAQTRPRSHATYRKPQQTTRWMPYKD